MSLLGVGGTNCRKEHELVNEVLGLHLTLLWWRLTGQKPYCFFEFGYVKPFLVDMNSESWLEFVHSMSLMLNKLDDVLQSSNSLLDVECWFEV